MTFYRQPQTHDGGVHRVNFPNALRNDGRADTYIDEAGSLLLVPVEGEEHDFAFSESMHNEGFSAGSTARLLGSQAIRYPAGIDLTTLPAVMNAARQYPEGGEDVAHILELTGKTTQTIQKRLGRLPVLRSIHDIGFDKTADRIELLAPYRASTDVRPMDILAVLEHDAKQRVVGQEEWELVSGSFAQARRFFAEGDHETHE